MLVHTTRLQESCRVYTVPTSSFIVLRSRFGCSFGIDGKTNTLNRYHLFVLVHIVHSVCAYNALHTKPFENRFFVYCLLCVKLSLLREALCLPKSPCLTFMPVSLAEIWPCEVSRSEGPTCLLLH